MPAKRKAPARKARTSATKAPRAPKAPPPQTVTPYLAVPNAREALAWYEKAFGAKVFSSIPAPDGSIMHAGFTIGKSQVFLSDPMPGMDVQPPAVVGGSTVNLHLHIKGVDKVWQRAVAAGAKPLMPLEDQFWGDRYGKLTDPFGHSWGLSWKAKMTKAEMARKQEAAMKMWAAKPGP